MTTTLVLNADAQPVSIVPLSTTDWKDAIGKVFSGRVTVIEEYDRWVARSPSVQIRMPAVVMCNEYQHYNGKVEFSRYNVILRDNYTCQYCSVSLPFEALTFDHVIPRREGGKTKWENIVTACARCNQDKAHFHRMKPKTVPRRPTYWELAANRKRRPVIIPDECWVPYINWEGDVIVNNSLRTRNISEEDPSLPFFI